MSLAIFGTMSPTNVMIPATETAHAARTDAMAMETVCIRLRFTPSETANSSPIFITLSSFEMSTEKIRAAIMGIITMLNSSHPLPERLPLSQYRICRTFSPDWRRRNPLTEPRNALIARPARIILLDEIKFEFLALMPRAIIKINIVVSIAVAKANGVTSQKADEIPKTNIIIAPNPAPAEIPSNPGSARLLRRSDWSTIPDAARANPMMAELRTLGSLISRIILRITSSFAYGFPVLKMLIITTNELFILPSETEAIIEITRIRLKNSRIVNFFFKKKVYSYPNTLFI